MKAKHAIQEVLARARARVTDYIRNYYDVLIRAYTSSAVSAARRDLNRSPPPVYLSSSLRLQYVPSGRVVIPSPRKTFPPPSDEHCVLRMPRTRLAPTPCQFSPSVLSISTSRPALNDNACVGVSSSAHPALR